MARHASSIYPRGVAKIEDKTTALKFWRAARLHFQMQSRVLALLLVLFCARGLFCQAASPENGLENPEKSDAAFSVHVNEVDLAFLIKDKHHSLINDLSADEILLRDNGLPPQSIRSFQSQPGTPLRIGLVFDTSSSILRQFKIEKAAAALFVNEIMDPSKDLAFILGFSNDPVLIQDLTPDKQALASAVQKLTIGGSTAIYDAVDLSCKKLAQASGRMIGRVLILVTDGHDNNSILQPESIIENAVRSNVTVIVLNTEPAINHHDPDYRILQKLAEQTGGEVLQASNKKQVIKAFQQLSSELRSYYLLAYRPAQFVRDGSYHKIQLKTTRRGSHIICRSGYYATSAGYE